MPAPSVSFQNISHTYTSDDGKAVTALSRVDFNIQRHEFVSLVGPSGCGKSTLLRLLSGLIQPAQGSVQVFGKDLRGPRDDVGIVFQKPTLLPWKTVLGNVLFPLQHKYGRVAQKDVLRAHTLLAQMGLADFTGHYPNQLSGGMQQRVGIARALLLDPDILIMDEPFSALDALTREQMGFELLQLWEQKPKTVLFITHSISEAVLLSDRVLIMSPRPGTIRENLAIDLPRPRSIDTLQQPAFGHYTKQIRQHFYQQQGTNSNVDQDGATRAVA